MAFSCLLCNRTFDTQRGLNVHSQRSHRNDTAESTISTETIDTDESISMPSTNLQDNNTDQLVEECNFMWGQRTSAQFTRDLNFVYGRIVYWRKNLFKLPSGIAGKDFIREITRLVKSWTTKSS